MKENISAAYNMDMPILIWFIPLVNLWGNPLIYKAARPSLKISTKPVTEKGK